MTARKLTRQLGLTLLLFAAWGALAQDDDEIRRHGIFVETIDVNLINVEVRVTQDGEPVTDLEAADFEVTDDGQPVEITNFYGVTGGRRMTPAETGGAPAADAPRAEPSTLVIVVDEAFLQPVTRNAVFKALEEKLERLMVEGTRAMVVAKDRDVRIEQRLTEHRAEVEAALERLRQHVGSGSILLAQERRILKEIDQGAFPGETAAGTRGGGDQRVDLGEVDARKLYYDARAHAEEVSMNLRRSVQVLDGFLASLAGLPGKKAVLYVCDELPLYPGEEIFNVWYAKYGRDYGFDLGATTGRDAAEEFSTVHELSQLIAGANANRVAFYPVSARKGAAQRALSAENSGNLASPSFVTQTPEDEGGGLTLLAHDTGGQASIGTPNVGWLFDRLSQDLTHYYSLAYPAPHEGDGERHKVVVKVKRPGLKVSYLRSYLDKSADQQMSDRTLAALYLDADANPLDVRVTVGAPEVDPKGKGKRLLVPVEVRFPLGKLVFLPREENHVGNVSIFVVVRDSEGRVSEPVKIELPIEIPNDAMLQALSQTGSYATKLAMRPGEQWIAVGVRDDLGSQSSTLNVPVEVGGG